MGRFLEHSRVYYFQNSPVGENTYLGSPDWMPRNFFRRVEVAFPIEEQTMENEILKVLKNTLRDNCMATELRRSGKYFPAPKRSRARYSVQNHLIEMSVEEGMKERESLRTAGKTEDQGEGN